MKKIDIRISSNEIELLKSLVGKTLTNIEHDEFVFTNTSSQVVRLNFTDFSIFLYSFTEPLDYYGKEEDVAVWSVEKTEHPILTNKSFIKTPIQQQIHSISLVQENQQVFENGEQIYDVWLTRGIILELGDYQFSFEKPVWFSEDIIIRKGYNLVTMFRSEKEIEKPGSWAKGTTLKCIRCIYDIK